MKDQDFDQAMDAWADHETEAAPEMRPTADMYRMVRTKQKRPVPFFYSRWAAVGAAVVGLMVFAVLYTALFLKVPSGREVALVGQRAGFASERGVVVRGTPPPRKGSKGEPVPFERLMFHFQRQGSQLVEGLDLQVPQEEMISLASADNYRLLLEPAQDRCVYIFQLTSSGILVKLFPNGTYSSVQNPLQQGRTVHLPSEPNWFYLDETVASLAGEERLYIVASAQPMPDLDDLYAQYVQADDESNRQALLSSLLEKIATIEETPSEAVAGWVFVFDRR
jgi:hypothetical protein